MNRSALRITMRLIALVVLVSTSILWTQPANAAGGPAAVAVMGQAGSFTNGGSGTGSAQFNNPNSVAYDLVRHRMFVADTQNNRVLIFNLSASNVLSDDTADFVLGQAGFGTSASGLSASTMNIPRGVLYDSSRDRLFVAEQANSRILVFNAATLTNGMAASFVIGQPDFVTNTAVRTQSGTQRAWGMALDGNNRYLFSTDEYNRRVMVWDTNSLATGMNASFVIGQPDFTTINFTVSNQYFGGPQGIAVDVSNNRLYVSATADNRILAFDLGSLSTLMSASFVIGQTNFSSNNNGTTQSTLYGSAGLTVGGGRLFVADTANNRVVAFSTSNTSSGQSAVAVWGQPDYVSGTYQNGGLNAGSLASPQGVAFNPGSYQFLIASSAQNRVLFYDAVSAGVTITGVVNPAFSFAVTGRATACNGQSSAGFQTGSTATALDLGVLSSAGVNGAAQDLAVTSNAAGGFQVYLKTTAATPNAFRTASGSSIADVPGTAAVPGNAPVAGTAGFGFTSNDTATTFTANKFAKLTNNNDTVLSGSADKSACVGFAAATATTTAAGAYSVAITYTAVPTF